MELNSCGWDMILQRFDTKRISQSVFTYRYKTEKAFEIHIQNGPIHLFKTLIQWVAASLLNRSGVKICQKHNISSFHPVNMLENEKYF